MLADVRGPGNRTGFHARPAPAHGGAVGGPGVESRFSTVIPQSRPMIRFLKTGISAERDAADLAQVRQTVEAILADIAQRGDEAVRAYSRKFDHWDPPSFKLSDAEVQACIRAMSAREVDDIRFAQTQIRSFAQIQRDALRDVEVETLPGVILGHRNIPVNRPSIAHRREQYSPIAQADRRVRRYGHLKATAHR